MNDTNKIFMLLFNIIALNSNNHLYQIWWRSVKGFLVGGGQRSPFPIEFAGRPYNSAMLPCALWYICYICQNALYTIQYNTM